MPLVFQFIENGDLDECLDAIEVCFRRVNQLTRHYRSVQPAPKDGGLDAVAKFASALLLEIEHQPGTGSEDAISELNRRFREHDVGYQFSSSEDQLVRTDSHYLYRECVHPAMRLLSCPGFEGPAQEFAKAHQHYRKGEDKAAVQEATKALESTIKAICHARILRACDWPTDKPYMRAYDQQCPEEHTGRISFLKEHHSFSVGLWSFGVAQVSLDQTLARDFLATVTVAKAPAPALQPWIPKTHHRRKR